LKKVVRAYFTVKMKNPDKPIPALLFAIVMDIIENMPLDVGVGIANLEEDEISNRNYEE